VVAGDAVADVDGLPALAGAWAAGFHRADLSAHRPSFGGTRLGVVLVPVLLVPRKGGGRGDEFVRDEVGTRWDEGRGLGVCVGPDEAVVTGRPAPFDLDVAVVYEHFEGEADGGCLAGDGGLDGVFG
jgi:hypothetical protein